METFFLACFVFGLLFTLASVVLGFGGSHLGHPLGHDVGHAHVGHAHVGHADVGHPVDAHLGHDTHVDQARVGGDSLPLLNASSLVGGLTWFGAAGYLLTRLGDWALPVAVIGALAIGAVGWYLVARFLGLVLKGEVEMNPADYRLEGAVGHVTVGIPQGGTGEVIFPLAGVTRSEAARAVAGGEAIPRGTEVVITAYKDGFATVQPWGEFLAERDRLGAPLEKKEA